MPVSAATTLSKPTPAESGTLESLMNPQAYTGLYGFHKYWGKKPVEPLQFLITALTEPGDLVVDPFLGSGAIARETARLNRLFIGGDVNPAAIRLTRFFLQPCSAKTYGAALKRLERDLRPQIDSSYKTCNNEVASHLLWRNDELVSVWEREAGKRKRIEREPTSEDYELAQSFHAYSSQQLRPLRMFHNGRINTVSDLSWQTLFTGRALTNIDLLLTEIRKCNGPEKRALELTLTSAVGQMSKMVFAITSRGKTTGTSTGRVEVGSWVIGYWRPETRFEINVWNCFESKAKKLHKVLSDEDSGIQIANSVEQVLDGDADVYVDQKNALQMIEELPPNSIKLLITDPPHGDRIPYLELSEMWNAVLDEESTFEDEVVVSNAKGRNKTTEQYRSSLEEFFALAEERIQPEGFLVLFFNSRRDDDWSAIRGITDSTGMNLVGCFPMEYSARSVVQDNRKGGMKNDYILIFSKGEASRKALDVLQSVPGWLFRTL